MSGRARPYNLVGRPGTGRYLSISFPAQPPTLSATAGGRLRLPPPFRSANGPDLTAKSSSPPPRFTPHCAVFSSEPRTSREKDLQPSFVFCCHGSHSTRCGEELQAHDEGSLSWYAVSPPFSNPFSTCAIFSGSYLHSSHAIFYESFLNLVHRLFSREDSW